MWPTLPKLPKGKMPRRPKTKKRGKAKSFRFRRSNKKSIAVCGNSKCEYRATLGMQHCPKCGARVHEHLNWADWHARRQEVYERDGEKCAMCHKSITLENAEIDHIKKRSVGGADNEWNLRLLCGGPRGCHRQRHATEDSWKGAKVEKQS